MKILLILLKAVYTQSLIIRSSHNRHIRCTRLHKKTVQLYGSVSDDVPNKNFIRKVKDPTTLDRRSWFFQALTVCGSSWVCNSLPASAGLVFFPCVNGLKNTYHLMRAGESLLETQDILSTNPLFLCVSR